MLKLQVYGCVHMHMYVCYRLNSYVHTIAGCQLINQTPLSQARSTACLFTNFFPTISASCALVLFLPHTLVLHPVD